MRIVDLDVTKPVVGVSAGGSHSLALRRDGVVLAWGNNSHGQLGDGKAPNDEHTPVAAAIQVSAP